MYTKYTYIFASPPLGPRRETCILTDRSLWVARRSGSHASLVILHHSAHEASTCFLWRRLPTHPFRLEFLQSLYANQFIFPVPKSANSPSLSREKLQVFVSRNTDSAEAELADWWRKPTTMSVVAVACWSSALCRQVDIIIRSCNSTLPRTTAADGSQKTTSSVFDSHYRFYKEKWRSWVLR